MVKQIVHNTVENQAKATEQRLVCQSQKQRPSCFNCKNLKAWDFPGTLEDPPDSGWECGLSFVDEDIITDEELESYLVDYDEDEAYAIGSAKDCPGYQFFDWDTCYKQQAADLASDL